MKTILLTFAALFVSGLLIEVAAQNPLAGLPSAPGSHIAQIQALGDNEWLNLGAPAADPQYGKGRGRSWGGYMAYASDMQGAFLAGQGTHGYINPDGRYDDIFFYDVNANKWICVFPGVKTTTFVSDINAGNLKMRSDGQLVDQGGQPVPLSYNGHSYKSYTYSERLKRWITVIGTSGIGGDQYSAGMQWYTNGKALLDAQMAGKTDSVSGTPFFYNAASGQFERYRFMPKLQGGAQGYCTVFDLPTQQKLWYYRGDGSTLLGDFAARTWTSAGATGSGPGGIDMGGCYDSKRDRIYLGASGYGSASDQGKVFIYDPAANAWSSPANTGARSFGASNSACVLYDSANDRVLDVDHNYNNSAVTVRVFNPSTWSWDETLPVPSGPSTQPCWHAFYSPELNAHFFYIAGDSYDTGVMWVYRYKKGTGSKVSAKGAPSPAFTLRVSPNPATNGKAVVHIDGAAGKYAGEITEVSGRTRVQWSGRGEWSVNTASWAPGVYAVRVTAGGHQLTKRMLVQ